jgi:hypothetical protein
MFLKFGKGTKMKVYFTAEEMHTQEHVEYVKWMSEVWRLNAERNKRVEAEKRASQNTLRRERMMSLSQLH